ncbi:MAG: restriction endonuclease subunit S [Bacteroidetes bacterium]|nr:restriction endonuclease subunit S [Bacteroidota bacterium]
MSWIKMQLGEVLINREGRYKPNDPSIANRKRIDKINFSGQIFISDKGSNTDMILVKKGDLVISGINVEKGAITVYEGEEDITATIHYSSYIFNTKRIDIEFLKVFLRSPDFIQLLKEQVPGGIKTEIKPKHILPLEVFFPDTIEEQREIANHFFEKERQFNELNGHISDQLTQIENLIHAILQEAIQGKLVKQNKNEEPALELLKRIRTEKAKSSKKGKPFPAIKSEEIPFEIPYNWAWCRLGEIVSHIFDGPFGSHLKTKDYTATGIQVIRLQNLGVMRFKDAKETFISKEKYNTIKQHTVNRGDIIIGSFLADGVNCVVLPKLKHIAIAKADCFTIRISHQLLSNYFIMYLLSSNLMFKELSKLLRGMTRLRINTTQLKHLPIPLPPFAEQKRIVIEIERQLAKTNLLKEHILNNQQATELLLESLLHEVFEVKEMEIT